MTTLKKRLPRIHAEQEGATERERKVRPRERWRLGLVVLGIVALMLLMVWLARWAGVPVPMTPLLPY